MTFRAKRVDGVAIARDAVISSCGRYRYWLSRRWTAGEMCLWVMLNPSTADVHVDDPTIRRCMGFAAAWGYGGIVVVNVYGFRATRPAELLQADDPIGPENDRHIALAMDRTHLTVAAWGANVREPDELRTYWALLAGGRPVYCLGTTRDDHPRHPLYLRGSTSPALYEIAGSRP